MAKIELKNKALVMILILIAIFALCYVNTAVAEKSTGRAITQGLNAEFPGISIILILIGGMIVFFVVKKIHSK